MIFTDDFLPEKRIICLAYFLSTSLRKISRAHTTYRAYESFSSYQQTSSIQYLSVSFSSITNSAKKVLIVQLISCHAWDSKTITRLVYDNRIVVSILQKRNRNWKNVLIIEFGGKLKKSSPQITAAPRRASWVLKNLNTSGLNPPLRSSDNDVLPTKESGVHL